MIKVGDKVRRLPIFVDKDGMWNRKHILEVREITIEGDIKFTEESAIKFFPGYPFVKILSYKADRFEIVKPKRLVVR